MQSRSNISRRTVNTIARVGIPIYVLALVRMRVITAEHLKHPASLRQVFLKNLRKASNKAQWSVFIDENFLKHSIRFWKTKEGTLAIVLYATAVEQYVNSMYQDILLGRGWTRSQITSLVKTVNMDAKLSWMFEAFTKRRFPARLRKRLLAVFSIRNAIVHFKGEPGRIDRDEDSYSRVEAQLRSLRRMSISRDFRLLDNEFGKALLSCDPDRELVLHATELLLEDRKKK